VTTAESNKRVLIEVLLRSGALLTGDFELKDGRRSPYFVDFGKIPDGESLNVLGACYANKLAGEWETDSFDLVFGPAYKAIPIAAATVMALAHNHGINKQYAFDRKVEKTYGERSRFIGAPLSPGTRALILDDVITSGGTKTEMIRLLESEAGVTVVGVVVGVDRTEDPAVIANFERETNMRLMSLCTIGDIDAVVGANRVAA
jgi:orotate phosphoribosyltransferase